MNEPIADIETIYHRHASDVYRFALHLAHDEAEAEEIVAETFARALLSAKPVVAATAKGYLFTIARRVFIRAARRSRRVVALDDALIDPARGADDRAIQRDELHSAQRALARLSLEDAAALFMRAVHEMSYDEIAAVLATTPGSAKVRVHRARKRLLRLSEGTDQ